MPLNTKPLKDVTIGQPVVCEGDYHARLDVVVKDNKSKSGKNLVVQCTILEDEVLDYHTEEPIKTKTGIKLTRYISLVPTENYDPDEQLKRLALAVSAPEDEDLEVEHLQGQVVRIAVVYKPAEGEYQEGNDIKAFMKPDEEFVANLVH